MHGAGFGTSSLFVDVMLEVNLTKAELADWMTEMEVEHTLSKQSHLQV